MKIRPRAQINHTLPIQSKWRFLSTYPFAKLPSPSFFSPITFPVGNNTIYICLQTHARTHCALPRPCPRRRPQSDPACTHRPRLTAWSSGRPCTTCACLREKSTSRTTSPPWWAPTDWTAREGKSTNSDAPQHRVRAGLLTQPLDLQQRLSHSRAFQRRREVQDMRGLLAQAALARRRRATQHRHARLRVCGHIRSARR